MIRRPNHAPLTLEHLEDRLVPAFTALYTPTNDTWTLTQVQDNGNATVAVTGTNQLQVIEGVNTVTFGTVLGSLTFKMLDNSTSTVTVDLDAPLTGSLSAQLGSGDRTMILTGGSVGGNLTITGASGAQSIDLGTEADLSVGGTLRVDLGIGDDSVYFVENASIGRDFIMNGVNEYDPAGNAGDGQTTVTVGGNLAMYTNAENVRSIFDRSPGGSHTVGGNFTYIGSTNEDDVFLSDDMTIGGNVYVNVGNNTNLIDDGRKDGLQTIGFNDPFNPGTGFARVGGSVTILGGSARDRASFNDDSTIGGSIYINTGTMGDDSVGLFGTIGGASVTVITGLGNDVVAYGMSGPLARLSMTLGLGDDSFRLDSAASGTRLAYLSVDFGPGSDTFTNNYGVPFTFPASLRNLP